MNSRRFTLASLVLLAACTQSQPAPQPQNGAPVSTCMNGWLYDTPDGTCTIACQEKTPECAAADCVARSFTGYLAGGVEVEVVVSYSATMGTMSTISAASKRSYAITSDTTYVLSPPGGAAGTVTASCNAGNLVDTRSGGALTSGSSSPASNAFSQALNAQINTGTLSWSGVAVTK